jgi:uncharacterized protein (DUF58 family)
MRNADPADAGVYVSLEEIIALEGKAKGFSFLPRQPVHSILSGRRGSKVRGRGLDFEELRAYLPGDDVRAIDWKVTARMRKPFVRVFTEEKDRPVLLLVDQRLNMFFGSQRCTKSFVAAKAAALAAWRVFRSGDRVGAFVFDDSQIEEVRPHRSRQTIMRVLQAVLQKNRALRADSDAAPDPGMLERVLARAERVAPHDFLVVLVSDLDGWGDAERGSLLRLAQHNDVLAILIYDPFLLKLPTSKDLVVSDGELQVELKLQKSRVRKSITDMAGAQAKSLLEIKSQLGIPVLPLSAAEEPTAQMRHLLGQAAAWRRSRGRGGL